MEGRRARRVGVMVSSAQGGRREAARARGSQGKPATISCFCLIPSIMFTAIYMSLGKYRKKIIRISTHLNQLAPNSNQALATRALAPGIRDAGHNRSSVSNPVTLHTPW